MNKDKEILKEIHYILDYEPGIDTTHIVVEVEDGIVKLTGSVHSSSAKWMAKEAVKHVSGVKDIKNNLEVAPLSNNGGLL